MALKAWFQTIIMALDLDLHISSTLNFSFAQVLVQDLLFKGFPKVMTSLEDNTKCYVQCIYIE